MSWKKILFFLLLLLILSPWGSPAAALALGLFVAVTIGNPYPALSGKPAKYLLQTSVVLLGFGMNLAAVYKSGREAIIFIVCVVFGALLFGYLIGKLLNIPGRITTLVSTGTAICGGSAIAAVGPAIKAENDEMSVSLGTIFVLNAVALFLFPALGHSLGMTEGQFGLWAAIAIQDTSSVVGASSAYGPEALSVAATVKLARTLWIAPLAVALAFIFRQGDAKARIAIPWFIVLFVAAATVRTFAPVKTPPSLFDAAVNIAKAGFTVTLFLIGLSLTREMLKRVGWRPFLLGSLLWLIVASTALWAVMGLL
ncbi:MAG TPA: putative sulfate exporter family transporter [Pyrinomonadaceae bacterium]|nr:putative sulfate exporter family transporter [Pyrinomonadaceae bacterium]